MEILLIYLIDITPSIHFACTVIMFLPVFLLILGSVGYSSPEEFIKKYKVIFYIIILLAVIALIVNVALPSEQGLLELLKLYKEGKL